MTWELREAKYESFYFLFALFMNLNWVNLLWLLALLRNRCFTSFILLLKELLWSIRTGWLNCSSSPKLLPILMTKALERWIICCKSWSFQYKFVTQTSEHKLSSSIKTNHWKLLIWEIRLTGGVKTGKVWDCESLKLPAAIGQDASSQRLRVSARTCNPKKETSITTLPSEIGWPEWKMYANFINRMPKNKRNRTQFNVAPIVINMLKLQKISTWRTKVVENVKI